MGHTGPSLPVEPRMAAPPKFGLLQTIKPEKNVDPHWRNGIRYQPEGCVAGETFDPCSVHEVAQTTPPGIIEWLPYKLTIEDNCSTFGDTYDERSARAMRLLQMDTERQLANEFWTGDIASASTYDGPGFVGEPWPNTWLANAADVEELTSGTGLAIDQALSCVDAYLARNNGGQQAAIHVPVELLSLLAAGFLIERDEKENTWKTPTGNIVIASPGYPGTSPDGIVGSGNVWMYGTDLPRIYLSDIEVSDDFGGIDRPNNVLSPVAERAGLVEFQRCRHAGVQVDIDICTPAS